MWMRLAVLLLVGTIALLPSPALAEVSDKVLSITQLWLVSGFIVATSYLIGLIRPYVSLFMVPIGMMNFWIIIVDMMHDPSVGPAIRNELGDPYLITGYLSVAASIVGPIIIWALLHHQKTRSGRRA